MNNDNNIAGNNAGGQPVREKYTAFLAYLPNGLKFTQARNRSYYKVLVETFFNNVDNRDHNNCLGIEQLGCQSWKDNGTCRLSSKDF